MLNDFKQRAVLPKQIPLFTFELKLKNQHGI